MRLPTRIVRSFVWSVGLAAASLPVAPAAAGPSKRPPPPPVYVEECGSCHVPYPARFLGTSSWSAVLAGLDAHFGVDASVDSQVLSALRAHLETAARSRETAADGKPLLRITETSWFRHEHPRPGSSVWRRPDVKSPANCGACHREAEVGDYRERSLRVPKKGEAK